MGFILDNAMKDNKDILIDLGYAKDAEERYNKLRKYGIGENNFKIECFNRLIMKCPKTKLKGLMDEFPIKNECHYWQTTHSWLESEVKE
jgi:hypothetical protein